MAVLTECAGSPGWGVHVYICCMPCERNSTVCVYMNDRTVEAFGAILFFMNHLSVRLDKLFERFGRLLVWY